MNGTNRGLNRALLGVFGLVLAAVGAMAVMAGVSRGFAQRWTSTGTTIWARLQERLDAARIPGMTGTDISWWSIAVLVLLLVLAVLAVCWIASQGNGRSSHLARQRDTTGDITVDTAVAAQAIKSGVASNTQILATSVQSWKMSGARGAMGLKITVQARKGTSPAEVTAAVEQLVEGFDQLLGTEIPVLIRIKAGTRTKFARTERVA